MFTPNSLFLFIFVEVCDWGSPRRKTKARLVNLWSRSFLQLHDRLSVLLFLLDSSIQIFRSLTLRVDRVLALHSWGVFSLTVWIFLLFDYRIRALFGTCHRAFYTLWMETITILFDGVCVASTAAGIWARWLWIFASNTIEKRQNLSENEIDRKHKWWLIGVVQCSSREYNLFNTWEESKMSGSQRRWSSQG